MQKQFSIFQIKTLTTNEFEIFNQKYGNISQFWKTTIWRPATIVWLIMKLNVNSKTLQRCFVFDENSFLLSLGQKKDPHKIDFLISVVTRLYIY